MKISMHCIHTVNNCVYSRIICLCSSLCLTLHWDALHCALLRQTYYYCMQTLSSLTVYIRLQWRKDIKTTIHPHLTYEYIILFFSTHPTCEKHVWRPLWHLHCEISSGIHVWWLQENKSHKDCSSKVRLCIKRDKKTACLLFFHFILHWQSCK